MANRAPVANGSRSGTQKRTAPNRTAQRAEGVTRKPPARKPAPAALPMPERPREHNLPEQRQPEPRRPAPQPAPPLARGTRVVGGLRSAGATVRGAFAGHAVPATLIGGGLAWLLLESAPGRQRVAAAGRRIEESDLLGRARETLEEVSDRVNDAAGSVKQSLTAGAGRVGDSLSVVAGSLSGMTGSVRGGVARLGEYTQEGARTVGATLRDGASAVGAGTRRGYAYSRDGAMWAWQQHPLATGLATLAAGVAVGMLLPGTRRENDTLGSQSDAVSQRLRTAGRTLVKRGKQVVSSAADALKQEAAGEGLSAEEMARKVRRIAGHVQEATASAARREGLDPVSVLSESQPDEPRNAAAGGVEPDVTRVRPKQ